MFNTLSNVMCTVGVCKLCSACRKNKVGITVVIKSHELEKGLNATATQTSMHSNVDVL